MVVARRGRCQICTGGRLPGPGTGGEPEIVRL